MTYRSHARLQKSRRLKTGRKTAMSEPFSRQTWLLRQLGVGGRRRQFLAAQALVWLGAAALVPAVLSSAGPAQACLSLAGVLVSSGAGFKLTQIRRHSVLLSELLAQVGTLAGSTGLLRRVGKVSKIYVLFLLVIFSAWLAYPWVSGDLKLLIPYWTPFEIDTFIKFSVIYAFASISLLAVSYTQEAVDTIVLLIAAYICRRLAEVAQSLIALGEDSVDDFGIKVKDEEILKRAISEHIKTIKLIREFDKLLTDIFLIQVLQTTIVSTMCFYAASKINDIKDIPKFFMILSATYMQLYIYCWLGEEISEHSKKIHRGVYQSKWYKTSLSVKKSINLIETFTKFHFKLNGGHIFKLHLETFLMMLKESFSYFMVLRAIVK